jgi:hypothetical protein
MIGFAALAIDIGMLYATHAEMQRAADSAALAAAWELLDENRLLGDSYEGYLISLAREGAVYTAARNPVLRSGPVVHPTEDVEVGYLSDLTYGSSLIFTGDAPANAVGVRVRRDAERGGSISLFFARFLGADTRDLAAEAAAAFADNVVGFEVTESTGNCGLLPFTVQEENWNGLLAGTFTTGDNYSCDPNTGEVTTGSDGVNELNLYPGDMNGQLPPGNFGTVDIGADDNSAADVRRQILYGVSEEDLSYFPDGRLVLDSDGTLLLNGDTGLSAGFKDALEAVKGQPRCIPIFRDVSGPGNNAMYTIVDFAGIRILNVRLTGPMSQKEVIVQPAVFVDDAAVIEPGPGSDYDYYVYAPVRLVR